MAIREPSKDGKGEGKCPPLTYAYMLDYCMAALVTRELSGKVLMKIYRLLSK